MSDGDLVQLDLLFVRDLLKSLGLEKEWALERTS